MMNNKNQIIEFYKKLKKELEKLEGESNYPSNFYNSFHAGQSELYQKETIENKIFDEEWILTIESYFPSLNTIVKSPRSSIKQEEEITAIEKAKKINSSSIKHLAANTHMLKEVRKDGTIIPDRILTNYAEIDYELYENRFIMTLIDRLFIFVRSRYNLIKDNVKCFQKKQVKIKSNFPVNDTKVDFGLDLTLTDEVDNKEKNEYNMNLLKRVEELNKLITSLKVSPFMELMKNANKIKPPIMKTNIILKNVHYHNAYLLWLFLDRYNTLAFSLEVSEKDLAFDDVYLKDIERQALTIFTTITSNHKNLKDEYDNIRPQKESFESYKFITTKAEEIKPRPEDYIMEDNSINEYYLEKYKEIFSKSLNHHQSTTKTDETALKRALRETLDIGTSLYSGYFSLNEENDIFKKLITEIDVSEELSKAKHKLFVSTMIREVKEVYYNDALRLERKLINEMKEFEELLLKERYDSLFDEKSKLVKEKEIEKINKISGEKREILQQELNNVRKNKIEIDNLRIETNRKINKYQSKMNKELRDEINKLSKKYDLETQREINRINRELKQHQRINKIKIDNIRKNEEKRLQAEIDNINLEFEFEMASELQMLKEKQEEKLRMTRAEMLTFKRVEDAKYEHVLNVSRTNAKSRRKRQRDKNNVILLNAKKELIEKYQKEIEALKK